MGYKTDLASEFAERIKALGFTVYLAESGTYGFITDETATRVLSFSVEDGRLGGNYGPPSSESGTGWRQNADMHSLKSADDVRNALYQYAPSWCGKGWARYTTVKQYLATYDRSSRFREVKDDVSADDVNQLVLAARNEGALYPQWVQLAKARMHDGAWCDVLRPYARQLAKAERYDGDLGAKTIIAAAAAVRDYYCEHIKER